ncbi:hypothetical protein BC831DRAFT_482926 [Entophlyctis helioformis]|nr:hypothetical protein BC831DRAFT_482926 [Entophlyctis helioformis]
MLRRALVPAASAAVLAAAALARPQLRSATGLRARLAMPFSTTTTLASIPPPGPVLPDVCVRDPPESLASKNPTTLVFLSAPLARASAWDVHVQPWFAERGYSSVASSLVDPDLSASAPQDLSPGDVFVERLARIAGANAMFPPVIIAHAFHALTVQRFIESHPCRAAILVQPWNPSPPEASSAESQTPAVNPSDWIASLASRPTPVVIETPAGDPVDPIDVFEQVPQQQHVRSTLTLDEIELFQSALADFVARPSLFEGSSQTRFPMLVVGFSRGIDSPLPAKPDALAVAPEPSAQPVAAADRKAADATETAAAAAEAASTAAAKDLPTPPKATSSPAFGDPFCSIDDLDALQHRYECDLEVVDPTLPIPSLAQPAPTPATSTAPAPATAPGSAVASEHRHKHHADHVDHHTTVGSGLVGGQVAKDASLPGRVHPGLFMLDERLGHAFAARVYAWMTESGL